MVEPSTQLTRILEELGAADAATVASAIPALYEELRRLARHLLRAERRDHTLQATALVHEAFLKLCARGEVEQLKDEHFFAVAARAMRQILVDHARRHRALKRGGGDRRVGPEGVTLLIGSPDVDILALDEALKKLGQLDERQSRIVELRFFAGLTVEEAASVMGISPATVKREWRLARAWLHEQLHGDEA